MSTLSSHIVSISNGINFRDLGGIKSKDGRKIRSGLLFRSGDFSQINEREQSFIANKLTIKNILDYRDKIEVTAKPNNLWHNVTYFNIPANPLSDEVTAALTKNVLETDALKKIAPTDFMIKLYKLLPFNNPAYKQLVDLLLNNNGESFVQHCAIGKDRTGVGVALTLFSLGIDEQTIMQDYLLSDKLLADFREKLLANYQDQITNEELENRKQMFAAKSIYLQSAIDAIKQKYDTIDNWLENEYQLTPSNLEIIRNYYLS